MERGREREGGGGERERIILYYLRMKIYAQVGFLLLFFVVVGVVAFLQICP